MVANPVFDSVRTVLVVRKFDDREQGKEIEAMASSESKQAWERFQSDMKTLAEEMRKQYKNADAEKTADLNRSLEQLRKGAEAVFDSLGNVSRDPEVRERTRTAARSFGSALGETFREVGDELEKAFRKSSAPK
jgi:hypothetical protein